MAMTISRKSDVGRIGGSGWGKSGHSIRSPVQRNLLSDAFEEERMQFEEEKEYEKNKLAAIDDLMTEYKEFENPWLTRDVFSDPLFQKISRSNRGTAANTLKTLQSGVSSALGGRGIKGAGDDLRYDAANEALRQFQESENNLAKELTSLFHTTGIAREGILGSLLNSNINAIMSSTLPTYDYTGEVFDKEMFEQFDKAMQEAINTSAGAGNQFLEPGTFTKTLYDLTELLLPFLMPNTMFGR